MAARASEAIFQATLRLLGEHGYDGLTIEGVAREAGVNKTTIYRWWPSKPALLRDALLNSRVLGFEAPDTGSLRGDLVTLVEHVIELMTDPGVQTVVGAMAAGARQPELAPLSQAFFADRFAREQPIFHRARERGELPGDADPMLLLDLLAGAVWCRVLLRGQPLEEDFATRAVDLVLAGCRA
ncbi:TetR/AcrR family transcriptional regulator [Thermoactinospora rubra]|uniref:TetR/AcrR family transcriptional regulator n=1 Tax=Thermoactinospora rubra TaxID=1088767 RepID=UPI000A116198|nr:TetR/AcrR family transcriptional regulator [Thermoactinospora rubra]